MSENIVHEEVYKKCTIKISPDCEPISPRNWDNAGKMVCWHSRYNLGDEQPDKSGINWMLDFAYENCAPTAKFKSDYVYCRATMNDALEIIRTKYIILPLYLYDHSGISISTDSFIRRAQHAAWDSGQVGWIYISKKDAIKEWGNIKYTNAVGARAVKNLTGEVKTYDDYLQGNVYGYEVWSADGEMVDSCWGFYPDHDDNTGYAYCLAEAKLQADYYTKGKMR